MDLDQAQWVTNTEHDAHWHGRGPSGYENPLEKHRESKSKVAWAQER